MSVDEIELTLPADDAFHRVAHLVLGGLATRHDLTVESLEDLTLALDMLLLRGGELAEEITVRVFVGDETVRMKIGPFTDGRVRAELERHAEDSLGLSRILGVVCDDVSVTEDGDEYWVELGKRIKRAEGEAA